MENKDFGYLTIGISLIIILLIFLFNNAIGSAVRDSCQLQHGDVQSCEMFNSVRYQTYLALSIAGLFFLFGLFLIFSKPNEKVVIKKVKEKKVMKEVNLSSFRPEEKQVYNLVRENGAMFQADIIEKTGFSKASMTRIVDKLEGNGLVERKRRGLTNVVVLKED